MLPFVGVDGEGGDVPDEYGFTTHTYTMLRAGNEFTLRNFLYFLLTRPKKHIYVSYFFDYDVTMMCRDLPELLARILVTGQPVQHGKMELKYRPRKEFTLRGYGQQTVVNDVGTFFQSSFVTALDRWGIGTEGERRKISGGKDGRNQHGALTNQIIEYNALECRLLEQLMDKFRQTCITIGYLPHYWQGPGQLAKAMLRKHQIPKTKDLPEPTLAGVWEAAQAAYFGGRFETSTVGRVNGPVDGWDINSAYPAAITNLPCLSHCEWYIPRDLVDSAIYQVEYDHPARSRWYGLPHRTNAGRIIFPKKGAGWYWGIELRAAQRLGARIKIRRGFAYRQHCEHRLFDFLHRLYAVRQAVGKSDAGIALKLAMNSLYGVFAQSVGTPPYANPIYAGLITATTRAKLLEAVALDPESVYMLATDGIFAAPGLPLTPSDQLGGWEHKHYPDGMHIVMPGVYFAGTLDPVKLKGAKTRGVSYSVVVRHRQALIDAYTGHRDDHIVVPLRQFIPLRMAVARNRLDLAGQWIETSKRIGYDWSTKRIPGRLEHTPIGDRTVPYTETEESESVPYSRAIGGLALSTMDKLEFADVPDWADTIAELP